MHSYPVIDYRLKLINDHNKIVFQVSQLTREVQQLLEASYRDIWVEAEISNLSKPASGHWYFSLKDTTAQLRCAMFRNRAGISRHQPKDGELVRVRGRLSLYAARGDMQLIVSHIEPAGLGALQQRFEELKNKLNQEGLFAQERKQLLPNLPTTIGIITSPSGAAIQDILTTLKRRFPCANVVIYPAIVQGDQAVESLCAALDQAESRRECDVILITRGGGSLEDLWCFNHEQLVRKIADCAIPVVSAVGHEVDVTLTDFVADLRAATPTAAAEILTPDILDLTNKVAAFADRLVYIMRQYIQRQIQTIDWLAKRLKHPSQLLRQHRQRLMELFQRLQLSKKSSIDRYQLRLMKLYSRLRTLSPIHTIQHHKQHLLQIRSSLEQFIQRSFEKLQIATQHYADKLNAVSYHRTLERGYSILLNPTNDVVISSTSEIKMQDQVKIIIKDGELGAEVNSKS